MNIIPIAITRRAAPVDNQRAKRRLTLCIARYHGFYPWGSRNKKSFTLIELLIAVTIVTVVILSVYSAFNTGILAYKKIDSAFGSYQEARIILNKLEADLKNSFVYSKESSLFKGSAKALDFFNVSQIYDKEQERTNLCRIKYQLEGATLKRTAYSGLAALTEEENVSPQDFSNSIKDIDFEYAYIGEGEKKDILWQNTWPQKEGQIEQLPLAVKIKLVLISTEAKQQKMLEFTKIIPLAQATSPYAKEK